MTKFSYGTLAAVFAGITVCANPPTTPAPSIPQERPFVVSLIDGSSLRVAVLDPSLEFITPHGPLQIQFRDVRRLELMLRVPAETARHIDALATDLGHTDFRRRDTAFNALFHHGERAIPALQAKAKSSDAETAHRAEKLLERLKELVPPERLRGRTNDLIFTADSKIAGRMMPTTIRVHTLSFGEQELPIADVRGIRTFDQSEHGSQSVIADPGTMANVEGGPMTTLAIRVTGLGAGGGVWGTDVYTLDTRLAIAAVHAGVLKVGQTRVIKVVLVGAQPSFKGTARNGITSADYGPYNGYRFAAVDDDS